MVLAVARDRALSTIQVTMNQIADWISVSSHKTVIIFERYILCVEAAWALDLIPIRTNLKCRIPSIAVYAQWSSWLGVIQHGHEPGYTYSRRVMKDALFTLILFGKAEFGHPWPPELGYCGYWSVRYFVFYKEFRRWNYSATYLDSRYYLSILWANGELLCTVCMWELLTIIICFCSVCWSLLLSILPGTNYDLCLYLRLS